MKIIKKNSIFIRYFQDFCVRKFVSNGIRVGNEKDKLNSHFNSSCSASVASAAPCSASVSAAPCSASAPAASGSASAWGSASASAAPASASGLASVSAAPCSASASAAIKILN